MGENENLQHEINEENKRYGDILQYKGNDLQKFVKIRYSFIFNLS